MFGVLTVSVDGKRVSDDLGPTGRLLAGYLFEYIDQVHRRERLVDMFWSRLDPDRARAAFNTALWRMRRLLNREPSREGGQILRTYGSEIVLEPAPWLKIDTHCFAAALKERIEWQSVEDLAARVAVLESAIRSYTGPFLDGEDADWILEERERLHSLYVRAETELLRCYGCNERYEDAIAAARRILASDPFRESVFRSLALLFVLNGQRVSALRHYERWRASFRTELGVDPMPQTSRLAEDIRSGKIFECMDKLKEEYFRRPDTVRPSRRWSTE
ncbi:AfsR/SARP family transcriptional regulator [Bradyrhizobium japonicum]